MSCSMDQEGRGYIYCKKGILPCNMVFCFLNADVKAELDAQAGDVRAKFERIVKLVQGLERVREPYIKHIEDRIWEMRLRGRGGIARALYVTAIRPSGGDPSRVHQEDPEDPTSRDRAGTATCKGGDMSRKMVPVEESFAAWRKDPEYVKAYNALEDEFSLAAVMIEARAHAGLTQEQLAERMHTTQAVIARLESGRMKPSTRTLERLAAATGMRLRISFEPAPAR
jgi:ribosome-binding protein aMBF1 (putative translation factor)